MNYTTQTLARFGKILASLYATRLAAVCADAHHVVARCNSDIRVAEKSFSDFARSLAGDGTVAPLGNDALASMERQTAEIADRDRWLNMDNSDLDALLT